MSVKEYDLVVIGSGPAGEKAAAQAAYFDQRVLVIDRAPEPGGAAVHTGTLPSKTLRETALFLSGHRSRELYGVSVELDPDATVPVLMQRKDHIAEVEVRRIHENLDRHGIEYLNGHASFLDPHTLTVKTEAGEEQVRGRFILIATGSTPRQPEGIAFADDHIHDSDEILTITRLPKSMVVLGAGVIGCEYACMFAALGVQITLVDAREEILPFLDDEVVDHLRDALDHLGIEVRLGTRWGDIRREGDEVVVDLPGEKALVAEDCLFAAGRVGATASLNLEAAGLAANPRGYLEVDECYRTAVPHILAAGDVVGFPALASTSMEQGRVAVCWAFDIGYKRQIATMLPYGIYTIPEVSAVGHTEQSAKEAGIDVVVGRALYCNNARGAIAGDRDGMTKLVVDRESRKVIGVHLVGEHASELVHIGQAIMVEGGRVDAFIDMVFNYPTLAESYKYAAYECLQAMAPR